MLALNRYLDGLGSEGKKASLVNINFAEHRFLKDIYGEKVYLDLMQSIVDYLEKYEGSMVFNTDEMDFIVVFTGDNDFDNTVFRIRRDLMSVWEVDKVSIELSPCVIALPEGIVKNKNADSMINIIRHFATETNEKGERDYVMIDAAQLREKDENDAMEAELIESMREDRIEAYYQPIINVKTGMIDGAEALARVRDADGNIIANDKLIPIAEKSGMIMRMGFRVFEGVCRFVSKNDVRFYGIDHIGVNLSTVQCMQKNLADDLIDTMKLYDLEGDIFVFEITESAVAYSKDLLTKNNKKLKEYGCSIALDRFGKRIDDYLEMETMDVEIVKLDRSLLLKCFASENKDIQAMGKAMVKMLIDQDKQVSVVGVETKEEFRDLKKAHVMYVQGRYFSDAVQGKELLRMCGKDEEDD